MDTMTDPIRQLGQFVRGNIDDESRSEDTVREARSRFQMSLRELRSPEGSAFFAIFTRPPVQRWALGTLGAVALCAAVTWSVRTSSLRNPEAVLTVALESAETELVGAWVSAENETKQLSFSDGTLLALHPHTKLRVRETTSRGATVDVGQGGTLARITPTEGAKWQFMAGPFRVRVTGTEFYLSWDPKGQVLELALHQGSVLLSGPTLEGERPVRKGQFLRVEVPSGVGPGPQGSQSQRGARGNDSAPTTSEADAPAKKTGQNQPSAPSTEPGKVDAGASDWEKALREGTPTEAVSAVKVAGESHVLSSASSQQLWALSQSARLGGRPELARDALLALRTRHGTRGQTSYLLGKISADQLGATSQAITWFETYLKETPGGSLAEQAMGRLAELQVGTAAGRRAAARYLKHYPRGSYANFCRSQSR